MPTRKKKSRHADARRDLAVRVQRRIQLARALAQRTRMMIMRLERHLSRRIT